MSNYADSSPVSGSGSGAGGKGGRKTERDLDAKRNVKNNDGRIFGDKYNKQCDDTEGNLPHRKAMAHGKSKQTFDPNADAQRLQGGTILEGQNREGLEEGAY